jgi:hypothetical protein
MRAADDGQADRASLLSLGDALGCARRGLSSSSSTAELLCVGKDQIHVLLDISIFSAVISCDTDLVEREHLSNHLPTILKCYLHAVVDLQL